MGFRECPLVVGLFFFPPRPLAAAAHFWKPAHVFGQRQSSRRDPGLPLLILAMAAVVAALAALAMHLLDAAQPLASSVVFSLLGLLLLWNARGARRGWGQVEAREQWLATTLRSIGDAVIATDAAGRITLMNAVAQKLTGWSEPEALGQPLPKVFRLLRRTDREPLESPAMRVMRGDIPAFGPGPALLIARDGSEHAVADSGAPIRDGGGEIVGAVFVFHDVTEKELGEERVRREKEFSDSLINSLPGIFYLYDARRMLLRWNRNFETVTGYSAEEIVKLDPLDFFPHEERPLVHERMLKCLAVGQSDVEVRLMAKDGTRTPYYVTGLRLDVGGQPCMLGIGIDITARIRAEESLRATMRRLGRQNAVLSVHARSAAVMEADHAAALRAITEVAAGTLEVERASVWFYDEAHSLIRCADLYEHTARRHSSGAELKAADVPRYFHALATERSIAAHDAHGDPRTQEFSSSYLQPLNIGALLDAPILSGGKMVGVICHEHTGQARVWTPDEQNFAGSMADLVSLSLEIAQRREAEAALHEALEGLEQKVGERTRDLAEANRSLQELDRLKSEFLATMSHELRTPLNSIIGFTGILRQGLAGPLNAEQKKQLGMVHTSARHLLGLINDLLDLSRIESGRMEVARERFPLAGVIEEVVLGLRPLADRKELRIEMPSADSQIEITGDRKKTLQILLNLVNNAVKFTERGHVRIETGTADGMVSMSVSDTGIGIRAEDMGRLFEAFRQVDGSARRVYEGTGLGLHLCRKLATLLGGSIGAESEFGTGSKFTVTLPMEPSPETVG